MPAGSKVDVEFDRGGSQLASVEGTVLSTSEIDVSAPDLAAFEDEISAGQDDLATEVSVQLSNPDDESESVDSATSAAADYDALIPVVDSVVDEATGESSGSITGGETLIVKGSGFEVPDGGEASVSFLDSETEEELSDVEVTPLSDSEIEVSSPDLSADESKAAKDGVLLTDVRVSIEDDEGAVADSELSDADEFSFGGSLTIVSGNAATFKVGDEGSFDITAEGAEPITLKESGTLPDGVEFTDQGGGKASLAGTPKSASRPMASVLVIRSPLDRTAEMRGSTVSPRSTQLSCSQHIQWWATGCQ